MRYVIFDLDGTIANINHRLHHIKQEQQNWEAFFMACDKDEPNEWALSLAEALGKEHIILIVSGRPERSREKTEAWLKSCAFPYVDLFLVREDGDHRPDELLKEQWLKTKAFKPGQVLFVVDDRQKVVDMWRRNGLVCLQCDAWPEISKPYPTDALKEKSPTVKNV